MQVQTAEMKVFVADDSQLALEGKVDIAVEIGTCILKVAAMVANMQVDRILGLNVIKRYDMIIDFKHGNLSFQNEQIPITYEGKFGCSLIVAQETFSIPP